MITRPNVAIFAFLFLLIANGQLPTSSGQAHAPAPIAKKR